MMLAAAGSGGGIPWELDKYQLNNHANRHLPGLGTNTFYPAYKPARVFAWKSDGTVLYVCTLFSTSSVGYIYQYNCSTAYDMSTASRTNNGSFELTNYEIYFSGLTFKPDGTAFYVTGTQNDKIHKFTMSTAWDVSTASFSHSSDTIKESGSSTTVGQPYGLVFKPDGTKLYLCENAETEIFEYTLSTAWDVTSSSLSLNDTYNFASAALGSFSLTGLTFNAAGTRLYATNSVQVAWADLNTAWDLTTTNYYSGKIVDRNFYTAGARSMWFNGNGTEIFINTYFGHIDKWNLSTAYDMSTASFSEPSSDYINMESYIPQQSQSISRKWVGLYIKPDNSKLYVLQNDGVQSTNPYIQSYSMTGNDVSTLTKDTGQYTGPIGSGDAFDFYMSSDGTKAYVATTYLSRIYYTTMSTAWDLSTAGSWSTLSCYTTPKGMYWKPDGTEMFFCSGSYIYSHSISTAWDWTTRSSTYSQSKNMGPLFPTVPTMERIEFGDSGYRLYVLYSRSGLHASGNQKNFIAEFSLSTAYDLSSTVTKISEMPFGDLAFRLGGFRWTSDGLTLITLSETDPVALASITSG